jgi:hypothetical protein
MHFFGLSSRRALETNLRGRDDRARDDANSAKSLQTNLNLSLVLVHLGEIGHIGIGT